MRPVFVALGLAVLAAGCAPNTIIANRDQAVVEAWSSEDAVARAREACEQHDRYAHLDRQHGGEYWFSCRETEAAMQARIRAQREEAMQRTAAFERAVQSAAGPSPSGPSPRAAGETGMATPGNAKPGAGGSAPETASLPRTGPWVQVGAFSTRAAAERYARDIGAAYRAVVAGHDVVVDEKAVAGRTLHVTRIGGFEQASAARRACGALKRRGAACFVDILP